MTNAIGKGTVNVTVNMPEDESRIWGRLAFDEGKSRGALLKELALAELARRKAQLADQIQMIRENRAAVTMALVGTVLVIASLFFGDIQRAQRSARRNREEVEFLGINISEA